MEEPSLFPIVGVGASAGGLDAFTHLLAHLPADTGMAFVFVQHLWPHQSSLLPSILGRATAMPVAEARQNTRVRPNHVYVIPPNTLMRVANSVLDLEARPEERGAPRPIDHFFFSLARDRESLGIGILLSGSDSDGVAGLQAIREEGGVAIVQTESSAKNPEMPRNAIAAGVADLILPPDEIGGELARIARHPAIADAELSGERDVELTSPPSPISPMPLNRLLQILRTATGIDFSGYKPGTLRRRIARRMLLQHHENFGSYLAWIESSPAESSRAELMALSEDVLIHVTGFFRDREPFELFEKSVLPRLMAGSAARQLNGNSPFRVWVPACSTGQEVYSIAMCLVEAMGHADGQFGVQIFGTDLSERAISTARSGIYPESEVAKLSPERQARFFVRVEGGFQIVKSVREMCVFARQNLLADPPFSHLNLISCRNVLIYLGHAMQRQIVATLHYALLEEGGVWVGHSEGLDEFPELFSQIDKHQKFYLKKEVRSRLVQPIRRGAGSVYDATLSLPGRERISQGELERTVERIVLSEFGPPWVLVNENFEIINSRGDLGPFIELPPGRATLSVLRMARDEIRGELRALLNKAKDGEAHIASPFHPEKIAVFRGSRLEVRRISPQRGYTEAGETSFLIVFPPARRDIAEPPARAEITSSLDGPADSRATERLGRELILANQRLQAILGERDAANQELISAGEEIQSSNEELQSINEELETSKEELQSSNEELNTVNEELQNRNRELTRLSDDLANLLSSAAIPILMLDNDLRIRRATPAAERLLNIRQTDVGRPISDIRLPVSEEDLNALVRRVLDTLAGEELELLDREGRWHVLRVRPYRTAENRIEGAVLTMIDIDQIRRARNAANSARVFAESLIEAVQTPLAVLSRDLRVRIANPAFLAGYGLRLSEVENSPLHVLGNGEWSSRALDLALGRLCRGESVSEDLEFEHSASGFGNRSQNPRQQIRTLLVNARLVPQEDEAQILLAATDITAQRRAEQIMLAEQERLKKSVQSTARELEQTESALHGSQDALRRSREELRALTGSLLNAQDEERRRVSRELHDDVSQNMAKLQFDIEIMEQTLPPALEEEKKRLLLIRDSAGQLSNDLKRIAYALHPSTLDHLGLTVALRAFGREFTKRTGIHVNFSAADVPARLPPEIASSFYRITQEALRNVAKHAEDSAVAITLTGNPTHLTLLIKDQGPGFDPEAVRGNGGLGLISMQERARLIRAGFHLNTRPGKGTAIAVSAPLV